MRIGIIGMAGRKHALSKEHVAFMHKKLDEIIAPLLLAKTPVTLVSGGAAGADHMAVQLANKWNVPLELHLPCEWDKVRAKFHDTGKVDWRDNPGGTANFYHSKFTKTAKCEKHTLLELHDAIMDRNTTVVVGKGFFDRNTQVANVDLLIAFTMSAGTSPNDGGTLDTWKKAQGKKVTCLHFSLEDVNDSRSKPVSYLKKLCKNLGI